MYFAGNASSFAVFDAPDNNVAADAVFYLVTPRLYKENYTLSFWYFMPGSTSKLDVFVIDIERNSKHVFNATKSTSLAWKEVKQNVFMKKPFTVSAL